MRDRGTAEAHDLIALEESLSSRELTSAALVDSALERYARTEPALHAFAWIDDERARQLAIASDIRRFSGAAVGRLEGIPIAVKDIFDTAGIPTENGSALFAGRVPARSSAVVRAAEAAGAIVLGKTVTAELAYLTPGATRNPWDVSRTPGGSSMGSAAAVAAGVVPVAIGSQTNGSTIRPAAFCGVVGYKPTLGRLSLEGALEFSQTLDHVGVFARTVRSAGLFAAILAGDTERRPRIDDDRVPRIAALRTSEWEHASENMRERFQADVDALAAAGGPVEWPSPPSALDEAPRILRTVMLYEGARALLPTISRRPEAVSQFAREQLAEGARMSDRAYQAAMRERDQLIAIFAAWAAPYDAILTPPTTGEAPLADSTGDPRFCSRWSLTGAPAITIPTGLGPNGLPLGLQLVAAPGDDARLLSAAVWVEAILPSPGSPPIDA
ncbi:MAG TPA: amidase [Candidatus Limnocylindrales bacterium]|nr:amidase [Candidatus Limnocylindrales bacterium]